MVNAGLSTNLSAAPAPAVIFASAGKTFGAGKGIERASDEFAAAVSAGGYRSRAGRARSINRAAVAHA